MSIMLTIFDVSIKENFTYQIFCRVTYVTGCYSIMLPLSEGLHVARSLQDIGLQEKYGLQTISSQWPNKSIYVYKPLKSVVN